MGAGVNALRHRYGASPLHLAGHVAALALCAYAISEVLDPGLRPVNFLVWLVGGALVHDLVLLPAYSLADSAARRVLARRGPLGVAALNHLRFPAVVSGVLLLVYFPLILVRADGNFVRATGRHVEGFGLRWAAITAGLFALSAIVYAIRVRASGAAARRRPAP